ncbi:hypothetical protein ES705_50028 [subsurface metagenome]
MHGRLILLLNPQVKCLHSPHHQVGGIGIEAAAAEIPPVEYLPDQLGTAADYAANHIIMAAQELGGAVENQVCAQGQWILIYRRGKGIVYNG